MTPLISTLSSVVSAMRADSRPLDDCLACGKRVHPDDRCVRALGGGFVHAACTTYRMRRHERTRRSLASLS